jgi:WD40 repeat protein
VFWDVKRGREVRKVKLEKGVANQVMLSDDASIAVVTESWTDEADEADNSGSRVNIVDVATGKILRTFADRKGTRCSALAIPSNGKTVALVQYVPGTHIVEGRHTTLTAWDTTSGKKCWEIDLVVEVSDENGGFSLIFGDRRLECSSDGRFVAVWGINPDWWHFLDLDNPIVVYEMASGKLVCRIEDQAERGRHWDQVAFSPDGKYLVSLRSGTVTFWGLGRSARSWRSAIAVR